MDSDVLLDLVGGDRVAARAYGKHMAMVILSRVLRECRQRPQRAQELLDTQDLLHAVRGMGVIADIDIDAALREILGGKFDFDQVMVRAAASWMEMVHKGGFKNAPLWAADNEETSDAYAPADGSSHKYFVILSSLNLIDVDKLAWDHLIEFRKDAKSRADLRKLRLFFSENYDGKSKDYVIDDLLARVEKQEEVARLWGFSTVTRSLGVAISDKSVLTTTVGGLAVAASGAPLAAAASVGLVITAGACLLEFGKAVLERRTATLDRPTEYLSRLRVNFGNGPG